MSHLGSRQEPSGGFAFDHGYAAAVTRQFAGQAACHAAAACLSATELGAFLILGVAVASRCAPAQEAPLLGVTEAVRLLRMRGARDPRELLATLESVQLVRVLPESVLGIPLVGLAAKEVPVSATKKRAAPKSRLTSVDGVVRVGTDAADASPVVLRMSLKGGAVAEITEAYVSQLQGSFPRIEVYAKLQRAAAWCAGNVERQKTPAGVPRFLVGWLLSDAERTDVRNAVLQTEGSRNGFGQGGAHAPPDTGTPPASAPLEDDDFGMATVGMAPPAPQPAAQAPAAATGALALRLQQCAEQRKRRAL